MYHQDLELARQAVRRFLTAQVADFQASRLTESVLLRGARVVGHHFVYALRDGVFGLDDPQVIRIDWFAGQTQLHIREPSKPSQAWDWRETPTIQRAA